MYRNIAYLILPVVTVVSTAACTAETSDASTDVSVVSSDTLDTEATDGVFCTYNSQGIGRGPYSGYYSRAQCDAYARSCGKTVILYDYRTLSPYQTTTYCFFQ